MHRENYDWDPRPPTRWEKIAAGLFLTALLLLAANNYADWHLFHGYEKDVLAGLMLIGLFYIRFMPVAIRRDEQDPSEEALYVVSSINNFLSGSGRKWDWDNFVNSSIYDPFLDDIRRNASLVKIPLDETGRKTLEDLMSKARVVCQS